MRIRLIAVGRLKEQYLKEAQAEYLKRLGRYAIPTVWEVPEESFAEGLSARSLAAIKAKEGERLLAKTAPLELVIALHPAGQQVTSEELAARLEAYLLAGRSELVFLIGGSLGLSPAALARADWQLSLSRLTLPHQLARVVLLEQVYRAMKITHGEPYHK